MNNDKAVSEFLSKIGQCAIELERIEHVVKEDHMGASPETLHWGHVGDAGRLLEQLQEITGWIGGAA